MCAGKRVPCGSFIQRECSEQQSVVSTFERVHGHDDCGHPKFDSCLIQRRVRRLLAVTSELPSSPHSVCVVTRALSTELLLPLLAACGWGAVVLESVCLPSCARHWCRNPAGTTHVVRSCFQGRQADVCMSFPRACSVAVFCRRGQLVCKANLLSAVSRCNVLRLLQPSLHMLTSASWSAGTTRRRIPPFADRPVNGIGGVLSAES